MHIHGALLNEVEVCQLLKLSRSWLRQARMNGTGPQFCKLGRSVRYPSIEIEQWLESKKRQNTLEGLK